MSPVARLVWLDETDQYEQVVEDPFALDMDGFFSTDPDELEVWMIYDSEEDVVYTVSTDDGDGDEVWKSPMDIVEENL